MTMRFNGTQYYGTLEGERFDDQLIEKVKDSWAITHKGTFGKSQHTIAWVIVKEGKILRFDPKLFKPGVVIFTWDNAKGTLVKVDTILES